MDMKFERETCIDNMGETLYERMKEVANEGRNWDAISLFEEWMVDGKDPEDGDYEFIFIKNFTLETN
tara:strand:+ start:1995 stop:2195 length:201 start_codon:yes stop_codon:yes gene_type:complete